MKYFGEMLLGKLRPAAAVAAISLLMLAGSARAQETCSGYDDCMAKGQTATDGTDYAAAADFYLKACSSAPAGSNDECKQKAADAYLSQGDVPYGSGDYDAAIELFNKAIAVKPDYAKSYAFRGDAHYNKKEYDTAIIDYSKTLELDPKHSGAYFYRGDSYFFKYDYKNAAADFSKAIELDPSAKTYYYRGDSYINMADYDRAIDDYSRAIELDPDLEYVRQYRGDGWLFKGNYDNALTDYKRVTELKPDDWHSFAYVAEVSIATRKKTDAITALEQTLSKFDKDLPPDEKGALKLFYDELNKSGEFPDPAALFAKAKASFAAGADADLDAASITGYSYFVMFPQSVEANRFLGALYEKMNLKSSSIRFYYRYLFLSPNAADKADVLKSINKMIQ